MRFTVDVHELLVHGRFGPLTRGATQQQVHDTLGPPDTRNLPGAVSAPVSIWVYGKTLCRGHLEFHFLENKLWMIFADYLPLRPYRGARFRFDPGCLGGLTYPSISEVRHCLAAAGAPEPVFEVLDPRWSDPPPPAAAPRIATRLWNKAVRRTRATAEDSASYGKLTWPSGTSLNVGYHHAVAASGEQLVGEDIALVLIVPMLNEEPAAT